MRSLPVYYSPSWLLVLLLTVSCGGENKTADDGSISNGDGTVQPNYDAFFADDPPPQYCGPDGGSWTPPPLPGGTPECPDDKNREGCPCDEIGQVAPCWPGKRVNRNRGICKDGTTTCEPYAEFDNRWGPCENFVLPETNPQTSAEACGCFSKGTWNIENAVPCLMTDEKGEILYATSTQPDGTCGPDTSFWSPNTLNVDCAGQFKLCYAIKAGDLANPTASDCELAHVCVDVWYEEKGVEQTLPVLPTWTSDDKACAVKFNDSGGYGEMTVVGTSIECDEIDDDGKPLVFHRLSYCPLSCNEPENQNSEECVKCKDGTSGTFP